MNIKIWQALFDEYRRILSASGRTPSECAVTITRNRATGAWVMRVISVPTEPVRGRVERPTHRRGATAETIVALGGVGA